MQDIATLRAFVTVAHEGSVSRAAERLHLTQPAISLKLKHLQAGLGVTLFTRRPQGLALTADGRALLPAAEQALAAIGAFGQRARALHDTLRGRLKIGTIVDPEFIRLGAFSRRLVERAPQLEIELHHGMSGSIVERISHDELDVGFFLAPPGEGPGKLTEDIVYRELTHFHYHVLAPSGWDERVRNNAWRHLATLPWIVTPAHSAHHRLLRQVLEPLGLTPNAVAQVDQEMCMLDLVRAGVGLSLARDALALAERQASGMVIVKGVKLPCALSYIWKRSRSEEPAIAAAMAVLERVWPGPEA
ncbi:LysR family transcriptional regulator [Halomonas sp. Bachu 37]|uniref:LysR family transcriptional regulator n=1 Tax=Halomonas kashgarensis TaxID=3084920 RepID=UPI0032166440